MYLHNILYVLIELFILRVFTFLLPPQASSLMELGNTFWLRGVLIVIHSVQRIFSLRVSKNIAQKSG